MGGNKDCEDFATACVSTINAIKRYSRFDARVMCNLKDQLTCSMTTRVVRYIREQMDEAYVTTGWVQINIQKLQVGGRPSSFKNEGHAWCSVRMKDQSYRLIECTTPILPHRKSHARGTESQHLFALYGNVFDLTPNTVVSKDSGYGPAQLLPRDRYKAVAYLYGDTGGYAVCQTVPKVGADIDAFLKNQITLVPLFTPAIQEMVSKLRQLDVKPDFEDLTPIILTQIDLHDRDVRRIQHCVGENVLPIMPIHSVRFIPASQLSGALRLETGARSPVCVFPVMLTPTAHGLYVGYVYGTSIEFRDIA